MSSASYRRAQRDARRAARDDPESWVIATDPGCHPSDPGFELHRLEVQGAMIALHTSGPWSGGTLMDCGCILELRHVSTL